MSEELSGHISRRELLIGVIAGSAAPGIRLPSAAASMIEKQALAAARTQAVSRRRRVIFNNDGDDIWVAGANTVEKFLAVRHTPLLNTHVDSIHYCTTQSFNHFTHDTRVAEVFQAKSGNFAGNNLPEFLKQNTDGLRMSVDFAREHGLESFWTLRMNDIHDAWTPEFRPDWKRQDASRVMSTLERSNEFQDRRRLWSLVDFEHPDVEPQLIAIVREVLENYNVDGIELDFLRAPIYFRSAYQGRPVTLAQRDVLTRLVSKLRQLVLSESQRQGRPILLSARVPATLASSLQIGIDVKAWLQENLLDVMTLGGGYIAFDLPVRELIELGHEHAVRVYPCLSQSGLLYRPPRGKSSKQPPEAWFGAATRLWTDQADGIYTFNLFPGSGNEADRNYARRILSTIGSLEKLQAETKLYAMSDAGWWMPSHYWAKDAEEFSGALPLALKTNDFTQTYMVVPEDLRGADISVTAELRVDFTGLSPSSRPMILFGSANFGPQTDGRQVGSVRRYTCRIPLQAISQGKNRVMVKVEEKDAKLAGVELWIRR